jgi:hypothetical protein
MTAPGELQHLLNLVALQAGLLFAACTMPPHRICWASRCV